MPKTKNRSPNKEDVELGFKLRKRRQDLGFSLEEVANGISISKQQLRKYELGRNKISARRLGEIANILEIKIDDLMGESSTTDRKKYSEIDKEAEYLWMKIEDPEHKRTLIAMMRMVIKNNT